MLSGVLFSWCPGHLAETPWLGDNIIYRKSLDNGYFSCTLSPCQTYTSLKCLVGTNIRKWCECFLFRLLSGSDHGEKKTSKSIVTAFPPPRWNLQSVTFGIASLLRSRVTTNYSHDSTMYHLLTSYLLTSWVNSDHFGNDVS